MADIAKLDAALAYIEEHPEEWEQGNWGVKKPCGTAGCLAFHVGRIDGCDRSGEDCPQPMEAAGDDGSFGPNESGIFFFTTEGVMVTYSGEYVLSDAPLKLSDNKLN